MANGTVALPRTLGKRLGSLPIAIGGAIMFVVAYGMNHGWKATFGPVLEKIGSIGIPTGIFGTKHPLGFLGDASRAIERWFSDAQRYFEKGMVWGFNNFVELPLLLAGTVLALSIAVFELGEWTATYVREHVAASHAARTKPLLEQLKAEAQARLAARVNRLTSRVDSIAARVRELDRTRAHTAAQTIPRIELIGRSKISTKDLHKYLKATLLGTLGALVVARALGRIGLGCLLGRNGKKAVGSLCKVNPGILDALLVDALALTVAFNLEEFARELQTVTGEAARLIHNFAE